MDTATTEQQVIISAVITRADGTVEDLGVIASTEDGTATVTEQKGPE